MGIHILVTAKTGFPLFLCLWDRKYRFTSQKRHRRQKEKRIGVSTVPPYPKCFGFRYMNSNLKVIISITPKACIPPPPLRFPLSLQY